MAAPVRIDELSSGGSLSAGAAVAIVQSNDTLRTTPRAFITEAESFNQSGALSEANTPARKLQQVRSILDWIPNGTVSHSSIVDRSNTTDLTAYVDNAISDLSDGDTIFWPDGDYLFSEVSTTKFIHHVSPGFSKRSTANSKPSVVWKLSVDAAYLYKFSDLQTNENNVKHAMCFNGIAMNGDGHTVTDALFVLEGCSSPEVTNSSISNVVGQGLRMREVFEPTFERFSMHNVDASGGSGVVNIDDRFNSNNILNCNYVRFKNCQFANNLGPYFFAHATANLDVLEVSGCTLEWGRSSVPSGGPWSVFELRQASRVNIHHNAFTNFKESNKYDVLFEMGFAATACTFSIHDNDLAGVDSSTYLLRALGNTRGRLVDTTQFTSSNARMLLDNQSAQRILFEWPYNFDTGNEGLSAYGKISQRGSAAGFGFVSVHDLGALNGGTLEADADATNTQKVVNTSTTSSAILAEVPLNFLRGYPASVRIGVRVKSATGAGTVSLQLNTTTFTAQTAASTYGVLWFDATNAFLSVLGDSGSDRFRILTGGANAEKVSLDGVYFVPMPHHYSATFTWNPGDLASGSGETSSNITVTGAALGDHVSVFPPYDLQGLTLTGYVSATNTVNARLENQTGGNVNLGNSASWRVKVTKP